MNPTITDTILVFTKKPVPGAVKTRLAATLGAEMACRLYREWVGVVLGRLQPLRPRWRVAGFYAGGKEADFAEWNAMTDVWLRQPAGDLGDRLAFAFGAEAFPGEPFFGAGVRMAIGTDCLDIGPELVEAARDALRGADAVFGPARDGGYYLVGLKAPAPGLFAGVRWSCAATLADQLDRCRALGLRVALLPTLADLDTEGDWRAWQAAQ